MTIVERFSTATTCQRCAQAFLFVVALNAIPTVNADDSSGTNGKEAIPASSADATDERRTGLAHFFDPDDGALDLSYFLESARGFLPVPIVITEPAVGATAVGAQACSCGRDAKRARRVGRAPTSRRSAGSEPKTEAVARLAATRAVGAMAVSAR